MGGKVIAVHSEAEWQEQLASNASKVIVVDFTASWCGPCRMIGPYFEELSGKADYADVVFLKVDVDECESVAAKCGISAMPTFQAYHQGEKVGELVGAAKDGLKALLDKAAAKSF